MRILGISCFYHDAAASLIIDGDVISAVEEERFSRIKHDFGFPINAINYCLQIGGIKVNDLDYIVFYEKPFLKFDRIFNTIMKNYPYSWKLFRESFPIWIKEKLWMKNLIKDRLNYGGEILFTEHHLSHAGSTFFASPFKEAAILTVDAVGEWTTTTLGYGRDNEINLLYEIKFPHSIGLLYSTFTAFLGFEVNEGEYKVMGMSPYGKPSFMDKILKIINIYDDGSFELNLDYFAYHYTPDKMFSKNFINLFGEPRNPSESGVLHPYYADIACSIQKVTEEILLKIANFLYKETKIKNLCIAGGVGLNSVANGRLLRETPFENIFVQPQAGDGGGALGAALYVYHSILKKPRKFIQEHSYLGPEYSNSQIEDILKKENISYKHYDEDKLICYIANLLAKGKIIGWFQSKMEWGPRALGNRSILADPRNPEMKNIVNSKVKFREPFRPFAPSVIAEKAEEFFESIDVYKNYPARFMLYVTKVREDKRTIIPAVTHIDGTARLQIVHKEYNSKYYKLIEKFNELTGVPVLLNTSFNLKGEPIVCTPTDAISTFNRSGLDVLVLNNFVIEK